MQCCNCCDKPVKDFITWTCANNEKIILCESCADFLEDDEDFIYTRNMEKAAVLNAIHNKRLER